MEGFVFDGQFGPADTLSVASTATHFTLRDTEVRRSGRDLIDLAGPAGVSIDGCLIHHALNPAGGRTDAHGIAAGPVRNLTVRNTEIHTFSGDGIQLDPGRAPPGWDGVTIERTRIWLAPLTAAENGFKAGVTPGENAIDTKANATLPRASLVLRDVVASGFRQGLIANMAAFNLKENVNVLVDGATVFDSEIAFRLRGPGNRTNGGAWVTVMNAVVYQVTTAFRYEDNIKNLRVWNTTIGSGVENPFQAVASLAGALEARNVLLLGGRTPAETAQPSNMVAVAAFFVDADAHDYHLSAGAPAIDAGVVLTDVAVDREGRARPAGSAYDIGAYERALVRP